MEDIIFHSFTKDSFIDKISQVISDVIQPMITLAINTAVANAFAALERTVLVPLKRSNKVLSDKVETFELLLKLKSDEIEPKNKIITSMQSDIVNLQKKTNDLEQYGRRISLRFFNIPDDGDREKSVLNTINNNLKIPILKDVIKRCHQLGRKQTIVKYQFQTISNHTSRKRLYTKLSLN